MICIIGSGRVGSSTAMRLAEMNLDDVMIIDIVKGLPQGEALDICQSCGFDVKISGSNDFSDMKGSDIVINAAGLARQPGMTRLDLMKKNAEITLSIAKKVKKYAPDCVCIQVANPVDLMAFVMFRETGFSRERVIGMGGMLDSQRFRYFIAEELKVSPRKVEAMVIGEHGDSMVPLVSQAKVNDKTLKELLKPDEIKKVVERTKNAGAELIGLKGSTFYAPSAAVTLMAEAVVRNTKKLFPASVYLQGEYGVSGIFNGVPAKLGNSGLEEIAELDIDEEEKKAFLNSCDVLKGKAKEIGLV